MDIHLLRTFLEVCRTRHFGRAADNLFLTQAAVSARIRLLERQVGTPLFDRKRKDLQLTEAGLRFLPHAEHLVHAWNLACQETVQGDARGGFLAVGGCPGLWDTLLGSWLGRVTAAHPELTLLAEAESTASLLRRLMDGALDLALLLEAPQLEGFAAREVARTRLLLVSTEAGSDSRRALGQGYVMVDWGTAFAAHHARHFGGAPSPRLRVGLGRMALEHILTRGGAAYLAETLARPALDSGRLFVVEDAPVMERQAFAVYDYTNGRLPAIEDVLALFERPATGSDP